MSDKSDEMMAAMFGILRLAEAGREPEAVRQRACKSVERAIEALENVGESLASFDSRYQRQWFPMPLGQADANDIAGWLKGHVVVYLDTLRKELKELRGEAEAKP